MSDYSVRQSIADMEEYSVEIVEADIIVNANESNYPIPEEIGDKISALVKGFPFNRYPPMKSENLGEAIAKEFDVDPSAVVVSNGSSELLEKVCYTFGGAGKKIAVPWPSFSMYLEYAELADSIPVKYPLTADGYVDPDVVIEMCKKEKPALLIICNPNNPTGNYNELADMEKIIANVDCPVVMDEAYMEFADGKGVDPNDMRPLDKLWLVAGSTLSLLRKYSNFMVFKTFSKCYGLAGLRCGYGIGSVGLMRQLSKSVLPYTVNALTLLAAKIVFENKALYRPRTKLIRAERDNMAQELKDLGFYVYDTATNFVCFRAQGELKDKLAAAYRKNYSDRLPDLVASGKMMFKYFMANSILTRDFTGHPVLTGCLRVTVGTPEENVIIMAKLKELLADL
ncbi:MAG: aminotransferase class I/II-fold pyridoxal phosphate-dependent enzyme [Phascolarctobacterium sp.]|nr:aminotransferase class I/II-fold pyridoxal phosphate-dependent enzyme [Phascolarctobacterium sp.]